MPTPASRLKRSLSRRAFVSATAAGTTGLMIVPRHVLGGPGHTPPSETVNIAIIGVGGQGFTNVKGLLQHPDVQIVAVADPVAETDYSKFYYRTTAGRRPVAAHINKHNEERAKQSGAAKPLACSEHIDYREMLEKLGKDIDAVLVATPDHGHAAAALTALKLGKHTFCEKPLTHSIYEARAVRQAAREANVATQMGNQGHCGEAFAVAVEWMRSKNLGKLLEIASWSGAGGFNQMPERPKENMAVPHTIDDWDLWIGPAPYRDYDSAYAPFRWRGWWDFGNGGLGDMGCHNIDQAFAAFDLEHPDKVECEINMLSKEAAPTGSKVTYHCPAKGDRPAVKFTWYGGTRVQEARPAELEEGRPFDTNGLSVRYEKGTILCPGWAGAPRLIPESAMASFERPPKSLPRAKGGHHRNWLDAIKTGTKSLADFDYSARLTEFVLLGALAMRTGETIEWDGENMKVTNLPAANAFVRPTFRKGWEM